MEKVTFQSSSVQLAGTLHRPASNRAGAAPGLMLCHGFGGGSEGAGHPMLAQGLAEAGCGPARRGQEVPQGYGSIPDHEPV